ncbi:hypothetical protein AG1IA_04771 [Rhizoctonia solani AG-1 IA]|uniref:Uncharacterized protein n=1 Tax=Thanatephorus cucumeris (strain AG1-IA) TaxID=983506 RepID=L8WXY0_THACA|nr:hypothetical protein AG1IA_04771 [Rhizoctonia solani AG-1 IA]
MGPKRTSRAAQRVRPFSTYFYISVGTLCMSSSIQQGCVRAPIMIWGGDESA